MKINPLYAILSGFEFGDTPGVGTFYDFLSRLWDSEDPNLSSHLRPAKEKRIKKPAQKGAKAEPVEKFSVDQLLGQLEVASFVLDDQPYSSLFKIYHQEFLSQSIAKGLIDPSDLSLAGDGTPVVTSARERKHPACGCSKKGITDCSCDRFFSQPDCDIGWDSSRDCFYFGYDLYMLVAANSESDLPVFPLLHPASKHDSLGFLETWFRMKAFLPDLHVSKWLLDSAHDAMPYYIYCHKNHIQPFIDLNVKRGIKVKYKNDFTIAEDGVPVCKAGRKMHHDGSEPSKGRLKFRCPLANRKYGCSCTHPCSDSKYGRTVHLAMKDNPKDFLQNLIREHDMPPKPVLEIDMAEFRTMQKLMIKAQDKAKEIRYLQDTVLPKLKQQLADTKGIFKGKERKALTEQIQRTEKEIAEKLDKLPDVLKEDGYPDVQAFMATYRKAEAVVEQYNRDLAAWERQVRKKRKPAQKEQAKPPERESVLKRLRQLQAEGKQRNQPRQRKKSFDRDSR